MRFTFLRKFVVFAAVAAAFTLQSCSDDDPAAPRPGQAGFYVVNEGGFGNSNASLSYYDRQQGTLTNDVFATKNGRILGDQAQSMTIIGSKGYIVVQNSNKIEVINADDFSSIVTITDGLTSPRYLVAVSDQKAYVSDWGADGLTGTIKVLDLSTNTITKTISNVGVGTNRMLKIGSSVYATNAGGFLAPDHTITIIDTNTDAISGTIDTPDDPNSLQVDKDVNLWVASAGNVVYGGPPDYSIDKGASTAGSLTKFTSNNKKLQMNASEVTDGGISNLVISNDRTQLYYLYNGYIYTVSTSAQSLPAHPFSTDDGYYGLAVDPFDGSIIGCKAPSFSSAGSIDIMDSNGSVKNSFTTGIAPNGCAFK